MATRKPSALRRVVGALVLAGLLYVGFQTLHAALTPHAGGGETPLGALREAIATPQVVVDEEVAVDAGGWQARSFRLSSAGPIQVTAEGRKDTDKGFNVFVMSASELPNLEQDTTFSHVPDLQGLKIRSFSKTATLPAGDWTVVVMNSENILRTMVVRLRVVVDPGD
ncbi:MAG TPA: hypothetical protein VFP84_24610 [Kofleriaceae bacterium]|nr:hypothetical protein [Kofleriaceae bacterium]